MCECLGHTFGRTCSECSPMYHAKPWVSGSADGDSGSCKRCECGGHADSCTYSPEADPSSETRHGDGGVCNCTHNTAGQHCDRCAETFFETPMVSRDSQDACTPCECNSIGTAGSLLVCNQQTGQCPCKAERFTGRRCDRCGLGFWGFERGCEPCNCAVKGVSDNSTACNIITGQCNCLASHFGRDCSVCREGFYQSAPGSVCQPCDSLCTGSCNGPGPYQCHQCRVARGSDGACLAECPTGHFPDIGAGNLCRECSPECLDGCTSESPTSCNRCKSYHYAGECVSSCHPGTFANSDNECLDCDPLCMDGCFGEANLCTRCNGLIQPDGRCGLSCPVGWYASSSGLHCVRCDAQCKQAAGCYGEGPRYCHSCESVAIVDSLSTIFCAEECPMGTVRVSKVVKAASGSRIENVCEPCDPECGSAGCTGKGPGACIGPCRNRSFDGACVSICPVGSVETNDDGICRRCYPGCTTCTGTLASDCTGVCAMDTYWFRGVQPASCVPTCPEAYYPSDISGSCEQCDPSCQNCWGPGPDACVTCANYFHASAKRCVTSCPIDTIAVASNATDLGALICTECDPNCVVGRGCSAPGPSACNACATARHKGICLATCPSGFYPDGPSHDCKSCDQECSECFGPGPDQCYGLCKNARRGALCIAECAVDEFLAPSKDCSSCNLQCGNGCTGPSPRECLSCASFQNSDGTCVSTCDPNSTFVSGKMCNECDIECAFGCVGDGPDRCTAGLAGETVKFAGGKCRHVIHQGRCLTMCPTGFYEDKNGVCSVCHAQCVSCAGPGPSNCTACRNFISESDGTCLERCDLGLTFTNGKRCQNCSYNCVGGCSGPNNNDCVACRFASVDGVCVGACPVGMYPNNNKICEPCDSQCQNGCYGKGPTMCNSCINVSAAGVCTAVCADNEYPHGALKMCSTCHSECAGGCNGPLASNCNDCVNWKILSRRTKKKEDDPLENGLNYTSEAICSPECPRGTHFLSPQDGTNGLCEPCHSTCDPTMGCTGPSASECSRCATFRAENNGKTLGPCLASCGPGHFVETDGLCKTCNQQCHTDSSCFGSGADQCDRCKHVQYRGVCIIACPRLTFVEEPTEFIETHSHCRDCDPQCKFGCDGPGSDECLGSGSTFVDTQAKVLYGCRDFAEHFAAKNGTKCTDKCSPGLVPDSEDVCAPITLFERTCVERGLVDLGRGECGPICPLDSYPDEFRKCQKCHVECIGGCIGEGPEGCTACRNFRDEMTKTCLKNCNAGHSITHSDGTLLCQKCNTECDQEFGCTGTGSHDCYKCRGVRTVNGTCASKCPFGETDGGAGADRGRVCACKPDFFLSGIPGTIEASCNPCHPTCSPGAGCSDGSASGCLVCAVARSLITDECVEGCSTGQVQVPNFGLGDPAVCKCRCESKFGNSSCERCSPLCRYGCLEPHDPTSCIGGPKGCTKFSRAAPTSLTRTNGVRATLCVEECMDHETVGPDGRCECEGWWDDDGVCQLCSSECDAGCDGAGPSRCFRCKEAREGSECTSKCSDGWAIDTDGVTCRPCDDECMSGCSAPSDPKLCTGFQRCRNYADSGTCVATCPSARPFILDCGTASPTDAACKGLKFERICVARCPIWRPLFNDTSGNVVGRLTQPALCVEDCTALGSDRVLIKNTQSCVTRAQATDRTAVASIGGDSNDVVTVTVFISIFMVVVVIAVFGYSKSGFCRKSNHNKV